MSTENRPVLEVTDLEVHYGLRRNRHRALTGVSLSVRPGEIVGIIGETGSGKSTLARAVLGLVKASHGRIVVDGEDVTGYSGRRWPGTTWHRGAATASSTPLHRGTPWHVPSAARRRRCSRCSSGTWRGTR